MKLVIEIPEDEYIWIKKSDETVFADVASKECMLHAIKNGTPLEAQPMDAVSRRAVLDTIGNVPDYDDGMVWEALSHAQRDVALLPPVTSQRLTGKWIAIHDESEDIHSINCSCCGYRLI